MLARPHYDAEAAAHHFYIWTDNLGTPRQISDTSNVSRWEWANSDPFGNSAPNENPASAGVFTYNLRFPGQYFDSETGKHYNYFRDYDAGIGRYIESDRIGLKGGFNTYGYVLANPLLFFDPAGLAAEMCHRPIQGYVIPGQHCFIRFNGDNGDTSSYSPGGVGPDPAPGKAQCKPIVGDDERDDCLKREMKKCKASEYSFLKNNCCHCVENAIKACKVWFPPKDFPNWPINPGPLPPEGGK